MITHKAAVGFIGRTQKTAKTECGKSVKVSMLAMDSDCTCLECKAHVDQMWQALIDGTRYAKEQGADVSKAEACIAAGDPKRYQTIYFL